ncbi:MAG TPA: hypothetical protein VF576_06475 [Rubricoccaceae bacterium]|jgi:hypothetical protein
MSYSAQTIVDAVYLAFGPLGLPLSTSGTACMYAGPDGTGCAIGVLLPRDLAKELDRTSPTASGLYASADQREPYARAVAILGKKNRELLSRLQTLHDTKASTPAGLAEAVRRTAEVYGLLDPARLDGEPVDVALAGLLGDAFRETHTNLVPA